MKKVITYGTFDLFHVGHLNILKRAKALGDYLVVAVSSDAFNAIKGKKCAIPDTERMQIVEAIKYVDEVSEIVHLDFPDEGYCDYLVVDGKGNFEMMVRFSDQNEVMKVINASSFTKQLEPTIYMNLPVSYQLTIKDYDYYLIYDADNRLYNESIEGESYVLCYKETTNLLY